MTQEQQKKVEDFGNAVAQLLVAVNVINFKMDLENRHVHVDMDANKLDTNLLESTQQDIEQLTLDIEE